MDFADRIRNLASRIPQQLEHIRTEEATKNALVMPFINALGYNVFDPTEVVPEFTADVGIKKGEKVDYAIVKDGKPVILLECKAFGTDLATSHSSQLYRYFSVTDSPFAVLTNGTTYHFYTDLDSPNRMDSKPFLVIDMLELEEGLLPTLKKLSKDNFDIDNLGAEAQELKYTREIKRVLDDELRTPSEDFVKYFGSNILSLRMTQNTVKDLTPIVKRALNQFVLSKVNERLQSAIDESDDIEAEVSAQGDLDRLGTPKKQIETTQEELEGFHIVKALLRNTVDPDRIVYRDTQSYFGILLDDNNRKPVCRLYLNSETTKYVIFFDEHRREERMDISSLNELYENKGKLIAAVTGYESTPIE